MRYKLLVLLSCLSLQGCLVIIPGAVVGAASDAITGAEGIHCVAEGSVVGGKIKVADGDIRTIKSLSGTSTRCQDSKYPIRALLVSDTPANTAAAPKPAPVAPVAPERKNATEIDMAMGLVDNKVLNFSCVPDNLQVGNRYQRDTGDIATVTKIYGKSSYCADPRYPIRADAVVDPASITETQKAAEALPGKHCVKDTAKIGDKIKLVEGGYLTIKSIIGKSPRCVDLRFPLRADGTLD
ncbi:hypothetical protein ACO0LF_31340 [Undibacterium sp. Di27W]|uniref:hypothetical protein n=1 Tax=Undibacterium sp. Di27W TaxID=3413036 RepID=UPI003BF0556C